MTSQQKLLLRLAFTIHAQLTLNPRTPANVDLPMSTWQHCEVVSRKLRKASRRGWLLAAERLRRDLRQSLGFLRSDLLAVDSQLEPPANSQRRVSTSDIYADLMALHNEFEEVSFDCRGHTLSVTTEPIELEGVYLGPFEIRLDLEESIPEAPCELPRDRDRCQSGWRQ